MHKIQNRLNYINKLINWRKGILDEKKLFAI